MSVENVREYLTQLHCAKEIIELNASTATVAEAAAALKVQPARIAKSISLKLPESSPGEAMVIVTAGDMKLDNHKFKEHFAFKAKMLSPEEAIAYTGHAVGGVCPFALPPGVPVFLDTSMKRFETMYPACGSSNSAIELTLDELEKYSQAQAWIDVCK
jgi:prolyl-tRNA editing enzyme YbaK/EbsC (Cys-tRNA(Pro) deacylase)